MAGLIKSLFGGGKEETEAVEVDLVEQYNLESKPWDKGKTLKKEAWDKRKELFEEALIIEYNTPDSDKGEWGQLTANPMYMKSCAVDGEFPVQTDGIKLMYSGSYAAYLIENEGFEEAEKWLKSTIASYLEKTEGKGTSRLNNVETLKKLQYDAEGYLKVSKWAFTPSRADRDEDLRGF